MDFYDKKVSTYGGITKIIILTKITTSQYGLSGTIPLIGITVYQIHLLGTGTANKTKILPDRRG